LAVLFFAVLFLAGALLAVDFLAVLFFAADELGLLFLAVDLVAVLFLAVLFLAVLFLAGALLAVDFLAVLFFAADELGLLFLAVDFVAGLFLAVDFLAVLLEAVDLLGDDFLAVEDDPEEALFVAARAGEVAAATVSFGSFFAPDTTAFRSAPALNFGTAVFLALIRSPVRGLRTQRASRTRFSKEPNPVIATFSPLATSRVIVSSTDSRACAAALRLPSKRAARVSTS